MLWPKLNFNASTVSEPTIKQFRLSRVPVTFISVMALLVFALGWLGWLLLDQDRSLAEQRTRERVYAAAAELETALADGITAERLRLDKIAEVIGSRQGAEISLILDALRGPLTVIHFSTGGTTIMPEHDILYLAVSVEPDSLPPQFTQASRLEFQHQDYPGAMRLLTPLAESSNLHIQASALLRLGRISRRDGRIGDALAYYETLTRLKDETADTVPARWLGLYARCSIFETENRRDELAVETARLVTVLAAGGGHVSKATYLYYADAATRWAGLTGRAELATGLNQRHVLSEMAAGFLDMWADGRRTRSASSGLRIGGADGDHVLGIWTAFGSDLLAAMLPIDELHAASFAVVTNRLEGQGIGWRVSNAVGEVMVSGLDDGIGRPSLRSLALGGMLFTVAAFDTPDMVQDQGDLVRRRLLVAGLALVLLIILASTYFISRSLRREAEIVLLQSEFVAAVSHEFRTPLTSIRQLTELLASGRVATRERAEEYYRILDKESARLQRLVEGLLDFGRMEAGAHPYHPETLDCSVLLGDIVEEFRQEYELTANKLSLEIEGVLYVRMDKESFTRAIWNLLDNAVKYSPESVEIEVKASFENDKVLIAVADHGIGFSAEEQSRIFGKFVRGTAAQATNTKGTGLGLAMVRKIIAYQGGQISAHRNPGGGSIFTITLEAMESP